MLNTFYHDSKRYRDYSDLLLQLNAIFRWKVLQRRFAAIQLFAENRPHLPRIPSPELLRIWLSKSCVKLVEAITRRKMPYIAFYKQNIVFL